MKKRNLPQMMWWLVIVIGVVAAAVCFVVRDNRPEGGIAKIQYDGAVVQVVSLDEDCRFALEQDPTLQFEVRGGAIRFIDATCPDKICERAGALSKTGETAACLPRKTVVTVVSSEAEGGTDAITG